MCRNGSLLRQFLVFKWRHGGHVGVQDNSAKTLLGIWFYYYAKLERHFAIVLYTNMALSSREWKPRIKYSYLSFLLKEKLQTCFKRFVINIVSFKDRSLAVFHCINYKIKKQYCPMASGSRLNTDHGIKRQRKAEQSVSKRTHASFDFVWYCVWPSIGFNFPNIWDIGTWPSWSFVKKEKKMSLRPSFFTFWVWNYKDVLLKPNENVPWKRKVSQRAQTLEK